MLKKCFAIVTILYGYVEMYNVFFCRMNRLCVIRALGGALKPRRHEQRLLR